MDIGSVIKVLARRWYLVVPFLLLVGYLSLTVPKSIEPDYEVTGALLLLGPGIREDVDIETGDLVIETVNPLLNLGASLTETSEVLMLAVGSQSVRAEFEAVGLEPDYEVGASDSRSPIMEFLVISDNKDRAVATLAALTTWVEDDLAARQDVFDIGPAETISIERLSYDDEPSTGLTRRNRATILLVGSGLLFTLLFVVSIDAALTSEAATRRFSRSENEFPDDDGGTSSLNKDAAHRLRESEVGQNDDLDSHDNEKNAAPNRADRSAASEEAEESGLRPTTQP